jgi:hypothetical protein
MWTHPGRTIRAIVRTNPTYCVLSLALVNALDTLFYSAHFFSLEEKISPLFLLMGIFLVSPFLGWVWLYYSGWVLYWTGVWFGGKASQLDLRAALAWSKIPSVLALVLWISLFLFHNKLSLGESSVVFINLIIFILGIWSLVLLVEAVRELQAFSLSRSILVVILTGFLAFLIIFAAMYMVLSSYGR